MTALSPGLSIQVLDMRPTMNFQKEVGTSNSFHLESAITHFDGIWILSHSLEMQR